MSGPLQIVAVVGCQRRGTTVTGQVLGAHPKAVLVDEDDGLYDWFPSFLERGGGRNAILPDMLGRARRKYDQADEKIRTGSHGAWQLAEQVTHLILKAPNLTFAPGELARLQPAARIVYPVRDPRSVVASMARLPEISMVENQTRLIRSYPALVEEFEAELERLESAETPLFLKPAVLWRIKSGRQTQFVSVGLQPLFFRYEDLILDKVTICRRLCQHVGLELAPQVIEHERQFVGFDPGLAVRQRAIDQKSLASWSRDLSEAQCKSVLETAGANARRFGYASGALVSIADKQSAITDEVLHSPIILTGRGGGGTRILAGIVESAGVFLGNSISDSGDSLEWVDSIYAMALEATGQKNGKRQALVGRWRRALLKRACETISAGGWDTVGPWGWKLPENMLVADALLEIFPQARLVHLVRHPITSSFRRTHLTSRPTNRVGYAVLKSAYEAVGLEFGNLERRDEAADNAVSWHYQVSQIRSLSRTPSLQERLLTIRYEDLCHNTEEAMEILADFLGCASTSFTRPRIDAARQRTEKWTCADARWVWSLCSDAATPLGYDLSETGEPIVHPLHD